MADPTLQPPQHWTDLPEEDDTDSALGDDAASSTASITSSILQYRTINGRTYHSDMGNNNYWGANDERQNETLDIQHHLFTLSMDGKLHFAPLKDDIEAIDIGTGTGLWAIDFGDQYPNCKVIGTDLSPIQSPWVPPNVLFQIDDFTLDWTFRPNSLDFVHTRWLIGSVPDWTVLMKQAYAALKPGGWIETYECNGFFQSDDDSVPEMSALAQWGVIFREGARKLGSTCSFSVPRDGVQKKAAKAAGFVEIHEKLLKIPISEWSDDPKLREIGLYSRAAIENDTEGSVGLLAGQLGWSKEAIHVYAAHVRKELRALKSHAYYNSLVVWAQKPLVEQTPLPEEEPVLVEAPLDEVPVPAEAPVPAAIPAPKEE
ncbi:methyltransferase type 12 [Grosmannia clavigera kw1407]|uniref:Methyltransferase type 12 n=1 Tax=Grosmannia clavigera (strain kw1407 / UAMH 11150) TaxID=655863 RepID=F0XLX2_GROCL|nr:methyltransferase type 12 [Grosmannia clavigera kw1407]EFX01042.1 methyltransferase type 12 [Grosmannia clavigera kw1407]